QPVEVRRVDRDRPFEVAAQRRHQIESVENAAGEDLGARVDRLRLMAGHELRVLLEVGLGELLPDLRGLDAFRPAWQAAPPDICPDLRPLAVAGIAGLLIPLPETLNDLTSQCRGVQRLADLGITRKPGEGIE